MSQIKKLDLPLTMGHIHITNLLCLNHAPTKIRESERAEKTTNSSICNITHVNAIPLTLKVANGGTGNTNDNGKRNGDGGRDNDNSQKLLSAPTHTKFANTVGSLIDVIQINILFLSLNKFSIFAI